MNENLSKKNYAKYDRTFMAFGSVMNAMQHIITEKNKEEVADWAWNWAKESVSNLVDELYAENEGEKAL